MEVSQEMFEAAMAILGLIVVAIVCAGLVVAMLKPDKGE